MTDIRSIGTGTQFCAVIGNPIAHSLSPAIHNAGYAELGLDFVYVACRVTDVESALKGMRALDNFRGMSITIPHKIEAMDHVDEIPAVDRSIGSINTVVHDGDQLLGLGTDGPGALKALRDAKVDLGGKSVLMLGAGGAARAIAFTLARKSGISSLQLLDVQEEMLSGLTGDLREGTQLTVNSTLFSDDALASAMEASDVIIHCTPVGMHPKEGISLIPPDLFRKGQTVFDIVYTPLETRLLSDAGSKGLQTISGVEMFVNQAVLQFEQFTGVPAPEAVMHRIVMEQLSS